ncbi:unnamed protein product [Symbiodinium natans]|uniref:Band 7 domain-containing protein n=1 Tax=Symbiodinium natans TaxID=878477 RepID=A0A812GAS2_9DINO|nr:unnamed protein product [Symbiodinium natans]
MNSLTCNEFSVGVTSLTTKRQGTMERLDPLTASCVSSPVLQTLHVEGSSSLALGSSTFKRELLICEEPFDRTNISLFSNQVHKSAFGPQTPQAPEVECLRIPGFVLSWNTQRHPPRSSSFPALGGTSAVLAFLAGSVASTRSVHSARHAKSRGREPFSNKVRTVFGQLYALLSLPLGGFGNFVRVDQGSVGVVLRFGKFDRMLDPGRHQFNVFVERVIVVPLKIACIDVKPQMVMTKDNLTVTIDAVCFYRVLDATKVLFEVQNYRQALSNLVQVTMRTVVGENELSEIFAQRPRLNARITELIEATTGPWGIEVSQVELKEVQIQQSMQRALAAVAEAQQEAEAKLIQARAQRESASILAEASQAMGQDAAALQLQWFETLRIIATQGKNATIILPDRIDPETALRVSGSTT